MASNSKAPFWCFLVLAAAAILPRLPLVTAAFESEDLVLVAHANGSHDLVSAVVERSPLGYYRPLMILHFEVCNLIFGDWAPGYHIASILLHLVVVWLAYLLCLKLVASRVAALWAAMGLAMIPSSNEAIAWAASVADIWATGFTLVAVFLALSATESTRRAEPWIWGASLLAQVAAFSAKETAIVAVLLVPLAAWLFGRRRPSWGWALANPAVGIAYLSWYSSRLEIDGLLASLFAQGGLWLYLENALKSFVMMLVPLWRDSFGVWLWTGPGKTRIVTILIAVSVSVFLVRALWGRDRVSLYGCLWSIGAFLPVCWLGWAERYAYLPAVGLAIVAAEALSRTRGRRVVAVKLFVGVVLVAFTAGSLLSANQWIGKMGRFVPDAQNRRSAEAQWKPAPKAVRSTRSPAVIRPC